MPFQVSSNWGTVPTFTLTPGQVTSYYNYYYNNEDNDVIGDIFNGDVHNGDTHGGAGSSRDDTTTSGVSFSIASVTQQIGSLDDSYTNGFTNYLRGVFGFLPSEIWVVLGVACALSIGYFALRLLRGF